MEHLLRNAESYEEKKKRIGSKKLNEYQRKSYWNHPEEYNKKRREKWRTSPEFKKTHSECTRTWIENNRDHFREIQREYQKTEKWKKYINTYRKEKYANNLEYKNKINQKTYAWLKTKKGKEFVAKRACRRRKLGFNVLCENIFENENIHWHHINNNDVVAIPQDIHQLYYTRNVNYHRDNLKPIIEQLYGWIP